MKVLLVTHNPICTYTNIGKTLDSLFDSFQTDELCQLYTYPSFPDIKKCSSYFRLSDIDILKNPLRKNKGMVVENSIINDSNDIFDSEQSKKTIKKWKRNGPVTVLLRDLMWGLFGWKTKKLYKWIKNESPTHVFVLPGRFTFISKIAIRISKDFSIPLITYICDDFYFVNKPKSLFGKVSLSLLRKQIDKTISNSSLLITVSNELTTAYTKKFSINYLTIMTGTNYEIKKEPVVKDQVGIINYFGNIDLGRYNSLFEIGLALDEINRETHSSFTLNVYSSEVTNEALHLFKQTQSVVFRGYVSGFEYSDLFSKSDLLVHVESFEKKYIDRVKHSVSTKIADSLASGICLFSFGPSNVSSIMHLVRNGYPLVVTEKDELVERLKNALFDKNLRLKSSLCGLSIAQEYHNSKETSKVFHEKIINL